MVCEIIVNVVDPKIVVYNTKCIDMFIQTVTEWFYRFHKLFRMRIFFEFHNNLRLFGNVSLIGC